MKKSHIIELLIFLILMTILTFMGIKIFKHTFDIGTTYHLEFKDINGIVIGSPVRILGVDIGNVTKIKTNYDKINVDFVVTDSKLKIPNGTVASIEFFGIAGSRSIELTPPNGKVKADGIIVENPIRLGDALGIMAKFIRASMVSVGGLYEFAKSRTKDDVENTTNKFLTNTFNTSKELDTITYNIERGGEKFHTSIEGTNKGMGKFTSDILSLNISKNFNIGRYAVNTAKRTLIKAHRGVKNFNDNSENYSDKAKEVLSKTQNINEKLEALEDFSSSMNNLENAFKNIDNKVTKENLDKLYDAFDNFEQLSENMCKF